MMVVKSKILDILASASDIAADAALVAGLPRVDSAMQCQIVEVLLHRAQPTGLSALPELYDRLDETAKTHIVAGVARLFTILRTVARSSVVQTRQNALAIIRAGGNLRLAYLVALALHDGSAKIRADAGATLREMTDRHLHDSGKTIMALRELDETDRDLDKSISATLKLLTEERAYLLAALRDALGAFESHHRPEVIEASMAFSDELEGPFFQSSTLKRGKLTHAMLEIISRTIAPRYALFTCIALGHPELRKRLTTLLATQKDSDFFIEMIRLRWLTLDPTVAKAFKSIRTVSWLGNGFGPAFSLPSDVAAQAPSWLLNLGLPTDDKVTILQNFLLIDCVDANRAAVWALIKINTPASTMALQSAADHDDPQVRRMARREVDFRSRRDRRHRVAARCDRPAVWSRLLDSLGISERFEDLWHNFERIDPRQARNVGHHALEFIEAFGINVTSRLGEAQPLDRLRAVRLVCALNLAEHFRSNIFQLANDPAPEVRAEAMRALAQIGDSTGRRILDRALNVEVPLVQSAAIEALDELGVPASPQVLEPLAENQDAYVRAAAIRALLKMQVPRGASALLAMLKDANVEHRCGALWVIDQMHLVSVLPRVQELAQRDPDPRIARSAGQVARRLTRNSRHESHRTASTEVGG